MKTYNRSKEQSKLWQNPRYRKMMSEAHKGYVMPKAQRIKISIGNKGKTMSKEAIEKIRISHLGKKNPMYGKFKEVKNSFYKNGYFIIHQPAHPFCNKNGFIREHRYIMEKYIKRILQPYERVHHINGIKSDNRIENLKLFKNESEHQKIHKPKGCLVGNNAIIHI